MPDTSHRPSEATAAAAQLSLLGDYRRNGDRHARDRAISMSMPLARGLALRHFRGREPLDDLLQVAYMGLVKAADRFEPDRGVAFSTFAVPTIMGELRRHFRDCTWAVHVPRSVHDAALTVEAAYDRLHRTTGRTPTPAELAAETGLTVDRVFEALQAREVSVMKPLDTDTGDEALSPAERVGSADHGFELAEYRTMLAYALRRLPEDERRVLALRFCADLKQAEIAARVGVSQMQISRLLHRALGALERQMRPAQTVSVRTERGRLAAEAGDQSVDPAGERAAEIAPPQPARLLAQSIG
jgi:RNA polymerase sigma-B factor